LLSAVASGDVARTAALLDRGAAVDGRDELGRTPLMRAVLQSRSELVRLLLDRGADPHVADNTGNTPLQQARRQNSREIIALLEARERAGRAQ
jgi:ankyrin repeat protein